MNKYQEDDTVVIGTSLANAYGRVCFVKEVDSYYMALDNYDGGSKVRISKEMFEEVKKIDWSKGGQVLDWSDEE